MVTYNTIHDVLRDPFKTEILHHALQGARKLARPCRVTQGLPASNRCKRPTAATLFCHLQLVNLEQEQNMVSCKAKNKSGGRYQLNPKGHCSCPGSLYDRLPRFFSLNGTNAELHVTLETIYQKQDIHNIWNGDSTT
jgi:hypothetical protein